MYKLYTDKNEEFECTLDIKNASLKNAVARLVVESDDMNFVFNGKINNNKCVIPIKRMKGMLQENVTGKIKLEVIVDDMYFSPWQSDYIVEEHTSVKVQVAEQKVVSKPSIQVSEVKESKNPQDIILEQLAQNGITKNNYKKHLQEMQEIFVTFFDKNKKLIDNKKSIIKETILLLK